MAISKQVSNPLLSEKFFELYSSESEMKEKDLTELRKILEECNIYFEAEYKRLFKSSSKLNQNYISESIFAITPEKIGEKQYIKIHLNSIINLYDSLFDYFLDIQELVKKQELDYSHVKEELIPIYYFFDDFMQFYGVHYDTFHRKPTGFCALRKTENFLSYDTFCLSELILLGKIGGPNGYQYYSMNFVIPSSISLIRLTIELILKNSLGIHRIKNKDGTILKISSYIFLDFFKAHLTEIEFPAKFSILKKIYEWSNYFVHGGEVSYYWVIWEAQDYLGNFFPEEEPNDTIKVDFSFFQKKDDLIRAFLASRIKMNKDEIEIEYHNQVEHLGIKHPLPRTLGRDFKIKRN